jgi:hypothetical protein
VKATFPITSRSDGKNAKTNRERNYSSTYCAMTSLLGVGKA